MFVLHIFKIHFISSVPCVPQTPPPVYTHTQYIYLLRVFIQVCGLGCRRLGSRTLAERTQPKHRLNIFHLFGSSLLHQYVYSKMVIHAQINACPLSLSFFLTHSLMQSPLVQVQWQYISRVHIEHSMSHSTIVSFYLV